MNVKKMLHQTWRKSLWQALERLAKADQAIRVAIVGIGQPLSGDDAVGTMIARTLRTFLEPQAYVLIVDAGPSPENYTGLLRQFQPDIVLLIDAAQMGESCGAIRWIDWHKTTGISASNHSLPLYMLASYVITELCSEVALLGIQPDNTTANPPLSLAAKSAARALISELALAVSYCQQLHSAVSPTR